MRSTSLGRVAVRIREDRSCIRRTTAGYSGIFTPLNISTGTIFSKLSACAPQAVFLGRHSAVICPVRALNAGRSQPKVHQQLQEQLRMHQEFRPFEHQDGERDSGDVGRNDEKQ